MRISDWSSDVCSSDLGEGWHSVEHGFFRPDPDDGPLPTGYVFALPYDWQGEVDLKLRAAGGLPVVLRPRVIGNAEAWRVERRGAAISATIYASLFTLALLARSEEHTSELQSIMRISYAVFCLQKKHNKQATSIITQYV